MQIERQFKRLIALFGGIAAIFTTPTRSLAELTYASTSATVVVPVTIEITTPLIFENLAKGGSGSTIIIDRSRESSANSVGDSGAHEDIGNVANFTIYSSDNKIYSLEVQKNIITTGDGTNRMTLTSAHYDSGLLTGEKQTISVIGKLKEDEVQVIGKNMGSVNVMVSYN